VQDVDVELRPDDIRIETTRVVGGGCSARITHVATGKSVIVDDRPTAIENRERALELLATMLSM